MVLVLPARQVSWCIFELEFYTRPTLDHKPQPGHKLLNPHILTPLTEHLQSSQCEHAFRMEFELCTHVTHCANVYSLIRAVVTYAPENS